MTPVETLHGHQYLSFKLLSALDCERTYAIVFLLFLQKDWQCFFKLELIKRGNLFHVSCIFSVQRRSTGNTHGPPSRTH